MAQVGGYSSQSRKMAIFFYVFIIVQMLLAAIECFFLKDMLNVTIFFAYTVVCAIGLMSAVSYNLHVEKRVLVVCVILCIGYILLNRWLLGFMPVQIVARNVIIEIFHLAWFIYRISCINLLRNNVTVIKRQLISSRIYAMESMDDDLGSNGYGYSNDGNDF